ncbi:TNF receptor-associated factor 6-like isoform X1 [Mauremys mutica]|uniref:TNF receptor-associated factor 6-like isoform X1 n=1 Tax=Mauremys mutica TaxID=74926 RepID=UPI001D16F22B|nr:TNF receptor-associated factor 6-like isoform X1 [Mauremys mutica]
MGYDIERFVGYVNEGLLCCICRDVLEDPLQAPCEHAFCTACIHGWLVHHNNCPEDRQALDMSVLRPLYRYMKNDLNRLQLHCKNGERGCEMVCSLESIDRHERECEYSQIPCSNAGCPVQIERRNLDSHLAVCEYRSRECPNGCGYTILRAEDTQHNCVAELRTELELLRFVPLPTPSCWYRLSCSFGQWRPQLSCTLLVTQVQFLKHLSWSSVLLPVAIGFEHQESLILMPGLELAHSIERVKPLNRSEMICRVEEAKHEMESRLDSQRRHMVQKESLLQNEIEELKSQMSRMMSEVRSLMAAERQHRQELEQAELEKRELMELLKGLQKDCRLNNTEGNKKSTNFRPLTRLESVKRKPREVTVI